MVKHPRRGTYVPYIFAHDVMTLEGKPRHTLLGAAICPTIAMSHDFTMPPPHLWLRLGKA